jgi:Fe-S cluster biogenesis protein NfuA
MPTWFKKVFNDDVAKATSPGVPTSNASDADGEVEKPVPVAPPTVDNPALGQPDTTEFEEPVKPKLRKIIHAPIIMDEEEQSSWSENIAIKARVEADRMTCVFMVDRPVLEGLSAWFPQPSYAEESSPLGKQLFAIEGIGNVLLHGMTVTIGMTDLCDRPWQELSVETGQVIRAYLKTGEDTITQSFRDNIPPEGEIHLKLQACVDMEINPGIAAHSGVVTLERIAGNSVYLVMGGGCQGCAASEITLRQGIHNTFRNAVPQIGGIFDVTDHSAGSNPFYSELPAGMD